MIDITNITGKLVLRQLLQTGTIGEDSCEVALSQPPTAIIVQIGSDLYAVKINSIIRAVEQFRDKEKEGQDK